MPVYPQTYRHYSGEYRPRSLAWTVICSSGIKRKWRGRATKFLLLLSLLIFLTFGARIYLAANLELVEFLGMDPNRMLEQVFALGPRFYYEYLQSQIFIGFLLTLLLGSDLIAADRKTGAISLYLSKPIGKFDYLFGKASVLMAFLLGITAASGWVLFFLNAFFHEDWGLLLRQADMWGRIAVYSLLISVSFTVVMLSLSSLVRSKLAAIALFCVVYFIPNVIIQAIERLTWRLRFNEEAWNGWSVISLQNIWDQLGATLFEVEPPFALHWGYYLATLLVVLALFSIVLYRQIRAVEVIR